MISDTWLTDLLTDWLSWVQQMGIDQLTLVLLVLLLVDAPRYAWSALIMASVDLIREGARGRLPGPNEQKYDYSASISVLIAGYNEADTIARTMESVWRCCPGVQMIVVDDGSTDGMAAAAEQWADGRTGIIVVRRPHRGGKSSALNLAVHYATGEIVVTVDADSRLEEHAIRELIQPMRDRRIAAVSGNVLAWNPFQSLAARLQAYEYRQTIFVSRMTRGRTGLLGIVSGAFGAFRTEALLKVGGWDVGPGEDGDIVLRLRKAGYQIGVAPYADCYTNVPTSWFRLFRQRCRWDRTVITFECRKHADMGNPVSRNFRLADFVVLCERWIFNVVFVYSFWLGGVALILAGASDPFYLTILLYLSSTLLELIQLLVLLLYSNRIRHDLTLALVIPLYPAYQLFMKTVDVFALTCEILFRESADDNFVPEHVRRATWKF
jgi:poly-beta-1,6-N-acetyl-D-glucosamine synthase